MDFIERIFHLAPDGGAGTLELSLLLVLLTLARLLQAAQRSARFSRRASGRAMRKA